MPGKKKPSKEIPPSKTSEEKDAAQDDSGDEEGKDDQLEIIRNRQMPPYRMPPEQKPPKEMIRQNDDQRGIFRKEKRGMREDQPESTWNRQVIITLVVLAGIVLAGISCLLVLSLFPAHVPPQHTTSECSMSEDTSAVCAKPEDTSFGYGMSKDASADHTMSEGDSADHTKPEDDSAVHTMSEEDSGDHTMSKDHAMSEDESADHTTSEDVSADQIISEDDLADHSKSEDDSADHTLSEDDSADQIMSEDDSADQIISEDELADHSMPEDVSADHTLYEDDSADQTLSEDYLAGHTKSKDDLADDTMFEDDLADDTKSEYDLADHTKSEDDLADDTKFKETTSAHVLSEDDSAVHTKPEDASSAHMFESLSSTPVKFKNMEHDMFEEGTTTNALSEDEPLNYVPYSADTMYLQPLHPQSVSLTGLHCGEDSCFSRYEDAVADVLITTDQRVVLPMFFEQSIIIQSLSGVEKIKLDCGPVSVTQVFDSRLAVTCPLSSALKLISLDSIDHNIQHIQTDKQYWYVTVHPTSKVLIVGDVSKGFIEVITLEGKVLKKLVDVEDNTLTYISSLTVAGEYLLVTDGGNRIHQILLSESDPPIVQTLPETFPYRAVDTAVDEAGNVFVVLRDGSVLRRTTGGNYYLLWQGRGNKKEYRWCELALHGDRMVLVTVTDIDVRGEYNSAVAEYQLVNQY